MSTIKTDFSVLWGSDEQRATEDFQPFANDSEAKAARDLMAKFYKALGKKVHRWTLAGQTRQYWGWGVECGRSCNVYKLDVED